METAKEEHDIDVPSELDPPQRTDNRIAIGFGSTTASGKSKVLNVGKAHTINLYGNLGAHEPSKRIEPDSTVPFTRDKSFVERKDIFDQIDAVLSPTRDYRWAALYGLGGNGKSQIAIEYTYRVRDEDPNLWVFWIYASNQGTVMQSVRTAVRRLNLPGHDDPKTDKLELMEAWLSSKANGPWLIVLDNVDDISVLHEPFRAGDGPETEGGRSIVGYIPQRAHGRVLITSRNGTTAIEAVKDHESLIKVDHMSEEESLSLLKCRTLIQEPYEAAARQLIKSLEYIPLAISQAGAYIQQLQSQISIQDYLEDFLSSSSNQLALLSEDKQELRRDPSVPNSVVTSWEISYKEIMRRSQPSAQTLALMSMFHRQRIPLHLVKLGSEKETRESVDLLEKYAFVSVSKQSNGSQGKEETLLDLHRLIQLATKKWLTANDEYDQWAKVALARVSEAFPVDFDYDTWETGNLLLPHAESVLSWRPGTTKQKDRRIPFFRKLSKTNTSEEDSERLRATLLWKLAEHDFSMGRYSGAAEKAEDCNALYQEYYRDDPLKLADAKHTLCAVYRDLGRYGESESLALEVIKLRKAKLGSDDLKTLHSRNTLAHILYCQRRYKEAEQVGLYVLKTLEARLGRSHPETIPPMETLASIYRVQGRLEEAERMEQHALKARRADLGADHPDTIASVQKLASIYRDQNRLKEAEQLQSEVVKLTEARFGADHPYTIKTRENLAPTLYYQRRFEEAEQTWQQALEAMKVKLGPYHPNTLTVMYNLAYTYKETRGIDAALALMEEVAQLSMSKMGKRHARTLKAQTALEKWRLKRARANA